MIAGVRLDQQIYFYSDTNKVARISFLFDGIYPFRKRRCLWPANILFARVTLLFAFRKTSGYPIGYLMMRARFLPLIILFAVIASCTKDEANNNVILKNSTNSGNADITYSVEGKWSVTKIDAYTFGVAGNVSDEVVYKQPLSAANYAEFTKDGICLWSTDHYYVDGEKGNGVIPQSNFRLSSFKYSVAGLAIDLAAPQAPAGPHATPESENATFTGPNTLVIHSAYAVDAETWVVSDSYFTRQ